MPLRLVAALVILATFASVPYQAAGQDNKDNPTGKTGKDNPDGPDNPSNSGTGTGSSKAYGDPIFVGFDEQQFDFLGTAGHSYTVLSTSNLTVNVEMVAAGPNYTGHEDGVEGTFIGGLSVLSTSVELYAHVDIAGNMTIFVNGLALEVELPASFNKGLLVYEPYASGIGQVITVQQHPFKLAFKAVKQLTHKDTGFNRGHLELEANTTSSAFVRADGILGATLGLEPGQQAPRDAALYEVSSLSQKAQDKFVRPTFVSRRRLLYA